MSPLACLAQLFLLSALYLKGGAGLKIVNLAVPMSVPNTTDAAILLDCDYSLELSSVNGLVVKWFLNDARNPVYQWIQGMRPQGLGVLRDRLDLNYRASDDPRKMFRALRIRQPSGDISGDYTCSVSTFDDEARETKRMTVYTPASRFEFTKEEDENQEVTLSCIAVGVYPEPTFNITASSETTPGLAADVEIVTKDGLFDSEAKLTLNRKDVTTKTSFVCALNIPHTDYTLSKTITILPEGASSGSSIEAAAFSIFLLSFLTVRV